LLLTMAIVFYALGVLDLIQMSFAFGAYLVLSWIYLFISPLFLPRTPAGSKKQSLRAVKATFIDTRLKHL
jgi:hypothetical protein